MADETSADVELVLVGGELVDPTVPGSMVNFEPPAMTPEESNEANDGYTLRTWLDVAAMHSRPELEPEAVPDQDHGQPDE